MKKMVIALSVLSLTVASVQAGRYSDSDYASEKNYDGPVTMGKNCCNKPACAKNPCRGCRAGCGRVNN